MTHLYAPFQTLLFQTRLENHHCCLRSCLYPRPIRPISNLRTAIKTVDSGQLTVDNTSGVDPHTPIENLPGIGTYYARKLKKLEIKTLEDLIYHFPFRYDDFSQISTISNSTPGEKISIQGVIWQIKNIRTRRGKFVTIATIADQSATIEVVWFNQPYLTKTLKAGSPVSLSGKIQLDGNKPKLISPSYEIIRSPHEAKRAITNQHTLHTGRLVPIYPETEGLSSKWLRAKISSYLPIFLKNSKDFLPKAIITRQKMLELSLALTKIHFPKKYEDVEFARKRLAFDEIFTTQLMSQLRKKEWQQRKTAPKMHINKEKFTKFVNNLPFTLTNSQKKAIKEILDDLKVKRPANRLLEGDVGSGKTVVAAAAAQVTHDNGWDTLLAAPTEILAFQHQNTLDSILKPLGVKVGIWTASKKQKGDITCGTHALLTSFKPEKQIGLVIVDEQHRFGVAQRAKLFLNQSQKLTPHLLTMTATPIPRTLALTLYGDLDLSIIDEMPKGRQKIATFVVPNFKRNDAYRFIEKEVQNGRQTFILTPFVEPSETMATVKSATVEFEKLKGKFSKKVSLGLLHGRLPSKQKEKIINNFKKNKIHILVATPVVEVGIDVPNATIMLIESADRFGLAQLHQLRGRVGRAEHKSYCFLFSDSRAETSLKRLKSMEKIHVGFELAEIDLRMRGAGEIFGLAQSGFFNFKVADLSDHTTIVAAQTEVKKLIGNDANLQKFPQLKEKLSALQNQYSQPN